MKRKCDKCARQATHHSVEIIQGQKIEKHLCEQHAAEEGLAIKSIHTPINELLTNFVKVHSTTAGAEQASPQGMVCRACGQTFSQFRKDSLLGCPDCYKAFEQALSTILSGPMRAGRTTSAKSRVGPGRVKQRQALLMRMRKQLDDAVIGEDYERAARLRDDIRKFEGELT